MDERREDCSEKTYTAEQVWFYLEFAIRHCEGIIRELQDRCAALEARLVLTCDQSQTSLNEPTKQETGNAELARPD